MTHQIIQCTKIDVSLRHSVLGQFAHSAKEPKYQLEKLRQKSEELFKVTLMLQIWDWILDSVTLESDFLTTLPFGGKSIVT